MDLLSPGFLFLLGLIPVIVAIYIWILRRRRRFAVRFSSLSLVREALPRTSRIRRHLPFALFLLALSSLMVAAARPAAIVSVPAGQVTVILAMDVSMSMCSDDIPPSRLAAAQVAAMSFVQNQSSNTQIGIVAFSSYAELVQPPTTDTEVLRSAIESLLVGRRTAIGDAILQSLDAISEIDPFVAPSDSGMSSTVKTTPVPQGMYAPDIIVLLTDGASNTGLSPLDGAQQAADRGVRVYTIGYGTAQGGSMANCSRQLLGNEPFMGMGNNGQQGNGQQGNGQQGNGRQFGGGQGFGGGGGFPGGFRRGIDEATLKKIADMTGGRYYSAESAGDLQKVFESLPMYLITKHEFRDISVFFTAFGAFLAATAIFLSLKWYPLP